MSSSLKYSEHMRVLTGKHLLNRLICRLRFRSFQELEGSVKRVILKNYSHENIQSFALFSFNLLMNFIQYDFHVADLYLKISISK